jgi:hypothetical protein
MLFEAIFTCIGIMQIFLKRRGKVRNRFGIFLLLGVGCVVRWKKI